MDKKSRINSVVAIVVALVVVSAPVARLEAAVAARIAKQLRAEAYRLAGLTGLRSGLPT